MLLQVSVVAVCWATSIVIGSAALKFVDSDAVFDSVIGGVCLSLFAGPGIVFLLGNIPTDPLALVLSVAWKAALTVLVIAVLAPMVMPHLFDGND